MIDPSLERLANDTECKILVLDGNPRMYKGGIVEALQRDGYRAVEELVIPNENPELFIENVLTTDTDIIIYDYEDPERGFEFHLSIGERLAWISGRELTIQLGLGLENEGLLTRQLRAMRARRIAISPEKDLAPRIRGHDKRYERHQLMHSYKDISTVLLALQQNYSPNMIRDSQYELARGHGEATTTPAFKMSMDAEHYGQDMALRQEMAWRWQKAYEILRFRPTIGEASVSPSALRS